MKDADFAPEDAKFFNEEGDPGFSPERNQAVIDGTIKKYEERIKKNNKEFMEKMGERSDAVATYLTSRQAESGVDPESYFGKQMMKHLRAQRIIQQIRRQKNGSKVITLGHYDGSNY